MKNRDKWVPQTAKRYSNLLSRMLEKRHTQTKEVRKKRPPRSALTPKQREKVLKKTGRRCHICGGKIKRNEKWQADHVHAYSKGGEHSAENYLPAHITCNNYRWYYSPEEFQEILKLGIWIRTQIIKKTSIGGDVAESFVKHEKRRINRRKPKK